MTTNNCTVYFFYRWQGTYIVEICKQKHEKKEFTFNDSNLKIIILQTYEHVCIRRCEQIKRSNFISDSP